MDCEGDAKVNNVILQLSASTQPMADQSAAEAQDDENMSCAQTQHQ